MAKTLTKDLTQGSPTRLIVVFAMTMLISGLTNYVYNLTDSLMVGHFVDATALGAVSAASPILMILNNLSTTIVAGFSITAGRIFGSGDHRSLRKMMANATYLTVIIVGAITAISLVLCGPMIDWTNTPEELKDGAKIYMAIIILAKPFGAPSWLLSGVFRAMGDTKTPVTIGVVNGLGNVFFNFLFLVVFPMGIAGAALGTLCSALTGSLIYLIIYKRKMQMLHFGGEDARASWRMMKRLLGIALPLGLESAVTSFGSLILQVAINGHGYEAVTGIAMGSKIMTFFWLFFSTFESSLLCFCSQNIGAGRIDRVRHGVRNTFFIFLIMGAAFFLLALSGLDRTVYRLFFNEADLLLESTGVIVESAHVYYFTQLLFFPFISMLFTWRAGLKAFGSTVPTLLCGVMELIARLTVSFFFASRIEFLYFAGPMAWVFSGIFVAILYPIVVKREMRGKIFPKEEDQAKPAMAKR
ncbi:MAG: hypothetical protein E7643_06915 [Ruminococcaceae bacterium]|nr:hypothetical protein [Oscillospiraceae bacterium]